MWYIFLVCKRILFDFIAYIYDSGSVQQPEEANAASGVWVGFPATALPKGPGHNEPSTTLLRAAACVVAGCDHHGIGRKQL